MSTSPTTTTELPTSDLLVGRPSCAVPPADFAETMAFAANDGVFLASISEEPASSDVCQLSTSQLGHSIEWSADGRLLAWLEGGIGAEYAGPMVLRLWSATRGAGIVVDHQQLESPTSVAAASAGLLVMADEHLWHLSVSESGDVEVVDVEFATEARDLQYETERTEVVGSLANGRPLIRRSVTWGTGYNDSIITLGPDGVESDFFLKGGRTSISTSFDYRSGALAIDWGGQCGLGCAAWGYVDIRDLSTGERILQGAAPPVPEGDSFIIVSAEFGRDGQLLVAGHGLRCGQNFAACGESFAGAREGPAELWLAPEWEKLDVGEGTYWAQTSASGRIATLTDPGEVWSTAGDLTIVHDDGTASILGNFVREAAWAP